MGEVQDFGWAIDCLKAGKCVRREGWNGKGMYLFLVDGQCPAPNVRVVGGHPISEDDVPVAAHVWMYTAQGEYQPGWLASQADMLADDWELVS